MTTDTTAEKPKRAHRATVTKAEVAEQCKQIKQYLASGVVDNKRIRDEIGLNPFQFQHRLKRIAKEDVSTNSDHLVVQYRLRKQGLLSQVQSIKKDFMEVKDDTGKILQKKDQNALLRCIRMEEEMVENEIQTLMKMGVIKSAPIEISHKLGELKSRWLEMLGLKPISTSLVSTTTKETSGATSLN